MRTSALMFRARGRLRREIDQRRPDTEIRQLWALRDACAQADGPDVVLIGDSAMFWVSPHDDDHRSLAGMVAAELGDEVQVHALAGPGYNPRLVIVFLEALQRAAHPPRVVVVPTSLLMASTAWLSHPSFGYVREAPALREILATDDRSARRLPRSDAAADWEAWDKMPAPSVFGARRTQGEIRLMINAISDTSSTKGDQPTTRWQRAIRLRHMMDLYNAEELTAEVPGVRLVEEMGRCVRDLGLGSVAYISPVNADVLSSTLQQAGVDRVRANAAAVAAAYSRGTGGHSVVDATFTSAASDFGDPVHLNSGGRRALAAQLAAAITAELERA